MILGPFAMIKIEEKNVHTLGNDKRKIKVIWSGLNCQQLCLINC